MISLHEHNEQERIPELLNTRAKLCVFWQYVRSDFVALGKLQHIDSSGLNPKVMLLFLALLPQFVLPTLSFSITEQL